MRAKNSFFKTTTVREALKMGPRKFVKDYLFPAMRREHGNGFAMQTWRRRVDYGDIIGLDGLSNREYPACHSVMCIGGTMQAVIGTANENTLARILGLPFSADDNVSDAATLFYAWTSGRGPWKGLSKAFHKAKTPLQKERIAEKAVLAAIKLGEKARA
jgi:hypothetical protein